MKIRRAIYGLLAAAVCWGVLAPAPVLAAGNIWMDEHAEVQAKDFKRIILFPIRYGEEPDGRVDELQADNEMLAKRVQKRIKRRRSCASRTRAMRSRRTSPRKSVRSCGTLPPMRACSSIMRRSRNAQKQFTISRGRKATCCRISAGPMCASIIHPPRR